MEKIENREEIQKQMKETSMYLATGSAFSNPVTLPDGGVQINFSIVDRGGYIFTEKLNMVVNHINLEFIDVKTSGGGHLNTIVPCCEVTPNEFTSKKSQRLLPKLALNPGPGDTTLWIDQFPINSGLPSVGLATFYKEK